MHKPLRTLSHTLGFVILLTSLSWGSAQATSVFFNEIHYDNAGADTGEAIEIAGSAGTDLTGWSIQLYNGNSRAPYNTISLAGVLSNQQNGFGLLVFLQAGIQNGSPDGFALIDPSSSVVQFLSYEGSFTAVGGLADGFTSTDIGVTEPSSTPVGNSLQLTGLGSDSGDFTWATFMGNTFGAVNTRQAFIGASPQPVPEPSTLLFFSSGIAGLGYWRWKNKQQI